MHKIIIRTKNFKKKIVKAVNNERGNNIIAGVIISAIILIALILLNTPIRTFISDIWELFSNFVEGKLSTLFSS
ncbi:hypothetical protein [Proteiniborus sp. MB09-C3]|uniref:hypothetical protein n=1 Tax=Proteiniborus sp. MB09-C3 TaxID=3050072 RepID=UPI00255779C5|nr:hypothetical protein [Proteiniborus sp. MB09-C3]WIV11141.1 hypothetical protein QO263_13410 [Proteiniborus sp. MB09-C3]